MSLTVETAIRHMLPGGTRDGRWDVYPKWPPDMFAVVASLIDRSGCYARLRPRTGDEWFDLRKSKKHLVRIGCAWRYGLWYVREEFALEHLSDPSLLDVDQAEIQNRWSALICEQSPLCEMNLGPEPSTWPAWWRIALQLLVIADEASAGVGFDPKDHPLAWIQKECFVSNFFWEAKHEERLADGEVVVRQAPPFTLCKLVSPDVACVLPKTRVPSVGCTIRSLSHHLALLPPQGEVRARWHQRHSVPERPDVFNLLVVPFPYKISGRCFVGSQLSRRDRWGWFTTRQRWLSSNAHEDFAEFIKNLLAETTKEVGQVDGVVLPELALDLPTYRAVRRKLQSDLVPSTNASHAGISFFISGVLEKDDCGLTRNQAVTTVFETAPTHRDLYVYRQSQNKHHRWKLDRDQIVRYSLGDALDPNREWWEDVSVDTRELNFFVFCPGSCFTTLICEDLARVDPCQHVIRSVGANLVIALLMDGPQLMNRWPARYGTVLAEDPGCSVLTVTSLGLVNRDSLLSGRNSRSVALWKDSAGHVEELSLPPAAQALCLTLTSQWSREVTLDGRDDGEMATCWTLSGALPVHCDPTKLPDFARE